jgi:hypothetical protein
VKMPPVNRPLVAAVFLSALLAATSSAFADDKTECVEAASKGQTLRDAHSLIEARQQFRLCARQLCPAMVQQDCGAWLGDVEKSLPTVVITAKDGAGQDLVHVEVNVDGQPLVTTLDGQAVEVNPGEHTFRFALPDGTHLEQQVLVKQGEKNQGIVVVLASSNPSPAVPSPVEGASLPATPVATSSSGGSMRLWGLIAGGAGIVGLGVSVGLGLDAKSKDNRASGEAGAARQTDSQSATSEGNLATVVFAVGAAALASGAVLWFLAPSPRAAIGTNGRDLVLRGSF